MMKKLWKNSTERFGLNWKSVGLFCFWIVMKEYEYYFHFFVKPHKGKWEWGFSEDWYDGPLYSFGLGPLLLVTWCWKYQYGRKPNDNANSGEK